MTVRELIDSLEQVEDKNKIVVVSSDGEGSVVSWLTEASPKLYFVPEHAESSCGYIGAAEDDGAMDCVCLWPL